MDKLNEFQNQLDKINQEISNLSGFRDTPTSRKFKRQLHGERSHILDKIKKLQSTITDKEEQRLQRRKQANQNRSAKMKRTWRYLKAIQANYPIKISLRELRTSLKKHRQGLETDIPDVAWRNPSP